MKNLALTFFTLIWIGVAAAAVAQRDIPQMAGDPTCVSGEYKTWANTVTHKIRKCENGTISDLDYADAYTYLGCSGGLNGDEYDPDCAPASSALDATCSDEFNNGNSATWTWVNQGTSSIAYLGDSAHLTVPNQADTERGLYCVPNNAADWTMTARLSVSNGGGGGNSTHGGLWLIDGGSIATPTNVVTLSVFQSNNSDIVNVNFGSRTGYATGGLAGVIGTNNEGVGLSGTFAFASPQQVCLQLRYVVSTKVLTARWAADCRNWVAGFSTSTRTLSAHPPALGFYADSAAVNNLNVVIQWVRFRTDAAGTSGEYLTGK